MAVSPPFKGCWSRLPAWPGGCRLARAAASEPGAGGKCFARWSASGASAPCSCLSARLRRSGSAARRRSWNTIRWSILILRGWGRCSTPWANPSTAAARSPLASTPTRCAPCHRRPMPVSASAPRSTLGSVPLKSFLLVAAGSAWGSSRARISVSRYCWPCWRATPPRTSTSSVSSASAAARFRSSSRTISERRGWHEASSSSRPRTSPR